MALALFVLMVSLAQQPARAGEKNGKEVVQSSCIACHGTGVNGAPKIGDRKAWSKRAAEGLTGLTQHALEGIRQMPAHGGNPNFTDFEIESAITYMVNKSGGHWNEPINKASLPATRTGEQIVRVQCGKCHATGLGGAPKSGDLAAWIPRMKQGLDALVRSAINGHGGMPARGGMADLTDAEIRVAVVYMIDQGTGLPLARSARAAAGQDFVVVDGITVYLGIVSAGEMRNHVTAELAAAHGRAPRAGDYHLTVAVFEQATGQRITDAVVTAQVSGARGEGRETALEKMNIANSVTYGNYVRMPDVGKYEITVHISRPGSANPLEARFEHLRQ